MFTLRLHHYRYHDQIAALESKIPAHEVNIPFKWKDAFDKGSLFGGRVSLSKLSSVFEVKRFLAHSDGTHLIGMVFHFVLVFQL